jgi:hypothetical protein
MHGAGGMLRRAWHRSTVGESAAALAGSMAKTHLCSSMGTPRSRCSARSGSTGTSAAPTSRTRGWPFGIGRTIAGAYATATTHTPKTWLVDEGCDVKQQQQQPRAANTTLHFHTAPATTTTTHAATTSLRHSRHRTAYLPLVVMLIDLPLETRLHHRLRFAQCLPSTYRRHERTRATTHTSTRFVRGTLPALALARRALARRHSIPTNLCRSANCC